MKILVPSSVLPNNNSLRIQYVSPIINNLKKFTDLEFFWFVYQPDKLEFSDFHILDIHDFKNAFDCLNEIKPDCVMIGAHYEPIQYAFSICCKKLNIPVVSFYYNSYTSGFSETKYNKIISSSRIMTSKGLPTDSPEKNSFLRRFRFILFKIKFLTKTKESIKLNSNSLKELASYFKSQIINKEISINKLPDLHLLPDSSWLEPLKKMGIEKEKLCVTGSPFWDKLYEISKNYTPKINTNNISILIITDALVEHGMWNRTKFTLFMTNLVNELSKKSEFSFSFKIHPSSENKTTYLQLFQKLGNNSHIYQNESVWDIIQNYDLVITFGVSTIHSELSLIGVKTILLDFNFNFSLSDFVKEGIKLGNILKCTNINNLNNMIIDFTKDINIPNTSFFSAREKFLYKFDGKSKERCSEAILNLLKIP